MTWGEQTVTHVDCRGGKWDEPLKFQRLNIQISLKLQCFKDCGAFGVLLTLLNLELGDSLKFECWSLNFFSSSQRLQQGAHLVVDSGFVFQGAGHLGFHVL